MHRSIGWLVGIGLCLCPLSAFAQVKKNPRAVIFTCPDHALDDQHELDVIDLATSQVVQTILLGDPPADANGDVTASINLQPITFGTYQFRVRAVAGAVKSADSESSETWERAPQQTGKPRLP